MTHPRTARQDPIGDGNNHRIFRITLATQLSHFRVRQSYFNTLFLSPSDQRAYELITDYLAIANQRFDIVQNPGLNETVAVVARDSSAAQAQIACLSLLNDLIIGVIDGHRNTLNSALPNLRPE